MQWHSRSAVAAAILGLGLLGAFAFRRAPVLPPTPTHEGPQHRAPAGPHFLEETAPPTDGAVVPSNTLPRKSAAADEMGRSPLLASLSPFDRKERPAPVIELACPERSAAEPFDELLEDHEIREKVSIASEMGPAPFEPAENVLPQPRTHIVADGDTLASLAEEYLGDKSRSLEIYEANRQVLPDPDLLPIGEELTIPPR